MSKRNPKTTGTEWLYLSMASFNGSGYADKSSPDNYYKSYLTYKEWKKQPESVVLAEQHRVEALFWSEQLCRAREAGHTPSEKAMNRFLSFASRSGL